MDVIPVIDLKAGQVVRAARGERHLYAPITTPLAPSSRPQDVVAGFLALHPFKVIYIADLDSIEGHGDHAAVLQGLESAFPDIAFWVDAGIKDATEAESFLARSRSALALGSESLVGGLVLKALGQSPRRLLSLDFRGDDFQGPAELFDNAALWPERIIVMTLARVGSAAGPDLQRLQEIIARAGKERKVYAAGGLRDAADLEALAAAGAAGVLVASALHDGRLDAKTLARVCK